MLYFYLPNISDKPFGGVRTIFDYIQRINELSGTKIAAVLSDSKNLFNFLPKQYATVQIFPLSTKVNSSDLLIVPEVSSKIAKNYPQTPVILAVLNWEYFDTHIDVNDLKNVNFKGILTNSIYSADYLKNKQIGLPIFHISQFIDTKNFSVKISIDKRTKNSIFILNRKNTHHLPVILEFLKDFSHTVTLANNIHPDRLSDIYNNHQFFINLGYPEGFCRPIAEAMASGCIPVGFSGGGASDFALDGVNSFIASDGNEKKLLEKLNYVLNLSEAERIQISEIANYIINRNYSKAKQAQTIYRVFKQFIPKKYTKTQIKNLYLKDNLSVGKNLPKQGKNLGKEKDILQKQLFQVRLEKMQFEKGYLNERTINQQITSSKFYKLWSNYTNIKKNIISLRNLG